MPIDRPQLFTLAWKSARKTAQGYPTLRAAFAATLRRVWELVKAMVQEQARPSPRPVAAAPDWFMANPYRARAVANRQRRLGTYSVGCW
ncbi:MAG: hypothetical protein HQL42_04085 [Alphaproteobacteria bacterium]|nr:hypothetical protein [Alphaproteobacteria bacterium]